MLHVNYLRRRMRGVFSKQSLAISYALAGKLGTISRRIACNLKLIVLQIHCEYVKVATETREPFVEKNYRKSFCQERSEKITRHEKKEENWTRSK